MVPTLVKNAIGKSRFIHKVVLVGANRPHNVALIVPEWPVIRSAQVRRPGARGKDFQ